MEPISFAFVWKEEQEILAHLAASVPENGIIVEVGTALGGTAMIFHQAVQKKGVRVYTIDAMDCTRATNNLKDTDVILIHKSSHQFAKNWRKEINGQIHFLYIDGDHNFLSVYDDFNEWFPFVAPVGMVAFHDYDPPERGGVAHFGVKICVDTLIAKGFLRDIQHNYKTLSGFKESDVNGPLDWRDCNQTLLDKAERTKTVCKELFRDSIRSGMENLRARITPLDSLEACYCLEYALRHDFEYLDTQTRSFYDFRRWVEMLSILEHAHGGSSFPHQFTEMPLPDSPLQLSRIIAHEQVRISILSMILRTLVEWEP